MINKQLRIISDDILNGHFIGYNQILDRFANVHTNSFPPHNVIKTSEDTYDIEFAVAGFSQDEISVTVENSTLTVAAEQSEPNDKEYVHCGISNRGFSKQFPLNEYWEVEHAESVNGILTISVKQEIPEAKKPKTIKIDYKS
jgi:molecular chaperone IbpA